MRVLYKQEMIDWREHKIELLNSDIWVAVNRD